MVGGLKAADAGHKSFAVRSIGLEQEYDEVGEEALL